LLDGAGAAVDGAVALWAGGEMTRRLRKHLSGVQIIHEIGDTLSALKSWRADSGQAR